MSESTKKPSLNEWVLRIRDEEMPIFGHTVQRIISVAEDDVSSAHQLAQVVLQDASMTTRILKLVNTTYYKTREESVNTISRAVVLLGFDTIRNMCLSISLVDSFVRGNARDRLTHELARAIHAAVQARAIAIERNDKEPEEIFIATLLYHIGDMAFWCFSKQQADELDALLKEGFDPEEAQQQVLGFRLAELSRNLSQEWRLSPLLREVHAHPAPQHARAHNIRLAHELAKAAGSQGWQASSTKQAVEKIAKLTGQNAKQTGEQLHQNARDAARIAAHFGADSAARAIPIPAAYLDEELPESEDLSATHFPEPDGMLQLKILRELSQMLETTRNFNMIMELVLEGVHRGVGMDRTLFALITPNRRELRGKFGLGHESKALTESFHFLKHPGQPNLFFDLLEAGDEVWYDAQHSKELKAKVSGAVTRAVDSQSFFVAPIIVCGKRIGLFYADRSPSARPLDQDAFDGFKLMANQANMGLTHIATNK